MDKTKQVSQTDQDEYLEFQPSKTYRVKVGCGNRYITLIYDKDKIDRVMVHRCSKSSCPHTYIDSLARQATFGVRRDVDQVISDLIGGEHHHCDQYNISVKSAIKQGIMGAFSCSDAVARVLKNAVPK